MEYIIGFVALAVACAAYRLGRRDERRVHDMRAIRRRVAG